MSEHAHPVPGCPDCASYAIGAGRASQVGGLGVWRWAGGYWTVGALGAHRLGLAAEQILYGTAGRLAAAREARR